jgi:DNA gyrase subunit B
LDGKIKDEKVKNKKSGTTIRFYPSHKYLELDKIEVEEEEIKEYCKKVAYLNSKLVIEINDVDKKSKTIFKFDDGLGEYLKELSKGKPFIINPIRFSDSQKIKKSNKKDKEEKFDTQSYEVSFCWINDSDEVVEGFCNSLHNRDGGTHLQGIRMAISTQVKKAIIEKNLISKKEKIEEKDILPEDCKEGLIAIVSIKHSSPKYSSQTKLKVNNPEIFGFLTSSLGEKLKIYFDSNPAELRKLTELVVKNIKSRKAAKSAKDKVEKSSKLGSSLALSVKFSDCSDKDPANRELWILEGKSAGGSAIHARNPRTQAIFPLRGKILNTQDLSLDRIMKNTELSDLLTVLGCEANCTSMEKLKYHKIIYLCDADVDGKNF